MRQRYDCPDVAVGPGGVRSRVVVATHPKGATKPRIGFTRKGVVYELFLTNLAREAFTAADVLALSSRTGEHSSQHARTKTRSSTWTAGARIRPGERRA